jgi:hypothetical protein
VFEVNFLKSQVSNGARLAQNVGSESRMEVSVQSNVPRPDPWEVAYLRFETPEQEMRKFAKRLTKMGATEWPRIAEIVELFCGRGNGQRTLSKLGFIRLTGGDLSASLLAEYMGPANVVVCDGRQ